LSQWTAHYRCASIIFGTSENKKASNIVAAEEQEELLKVGEQLAND
jgi:hypothetical protein